MSRRKHLLVIGMVALLAAVSITGYTTLEATASQNTLADQPPSEETIEQHALNNTTTIESVTGTVTINGTIDNGTQPMQAQIWQQPPNHVRYEYVSLIALGPNRGGLIGFSSADAPITASAADTTAHYRIMHRSEFVVPVPGGPV